MTRSQPFAGWASTFNFFADDEPMNGKELAEAIAAKYGIPAKGSRTQMMNRAVRTLPGGNELLDAIEATNAARNHAARHKATDRVIAIDAALDRFEAIRDAMVKSIMDSVQAE